MEIVKASPFEKDEFGSLVTLPEKVASWKIETDNLKVAAERFQQQLPTDLAALTVEQLDAFDIRLVKTIATIGSAFSRIEAERKAGTAILDEIKAYSMLPEKTIANYPATFKTHRDAIAREKARRVREAEELRNKEISKKQDIISYKASCKSFYSDYFRFQQVEPVIKRMINAFNNATVESIEEVGKTLAAYVPAYNGKQTEELKSKILDHPSQPLTISMTEGEAIRAEALYELIDLFSKEYSTVITAERDRLIELIPSRKRELEEIAKGNAKAKADAEARQKQEEADRAEALARQQEEQSQALQTAAEVDKTNALFDSEAATPIIQQAKGTTERKKYQPKTHKAFAALLQSWVKNTMPLMTMEELNKRLSWAITAANERLNKGEVIQADGLEVVDDYSTRTSRKGKEVVV